MTPRRIGIVLFDGVEELDAVGPWEVIAYWTQGHPEDGWEVLTLSPSGGSVEAAKGMVLGAQHAFASAPALDVVIHPGGQGTRLLMRDAAHLEWVRAQRQRGALMASVCTGALVYAAAGLLRGRPATTHWSALELLASLDPSVEVRGDERWIDDGDVITASGVSAGIDMALHLVDRLAGVERARGARRGIQYDPEPPIE